MILIFSVLSIPLLQFKSSLSLTIITQITHKCYYNFSIFQFCFIFFFWEWDHLILMLYYQASTLSKGRLMSFQLSLSLSRHLIVHKKTLKETSSKSCLFIKFMTSVLHCRSQSHGVLILPADQDPVFSLPLLLSIYLSSWNPYFQSSLGVIFHSPQLN